MVASNNTNNNITTLFLLLALASCTSIAAQTQTSQSLCSCSPTKFTFTLSNLDYGNGCETNDIDSNSGISASFCSVDAGVSLPSPPIEDADASEQVRHHRRLDDTAPAAEEEDPIVEIISVQFLEFDTSGDLTVINQDDTYTDVSLASGSKLEFYSASSFLDTSLSLEDQMSNPAIVPGGASLILYGKTTSGDIVRNRFFWTYDMGCGRDTTPVEVGDEIGWVTVTETSNAWPVFCPALPPGTPTIGPRTNEPTLTPSKSPSDRPTKSPSASPSERSGDATLSPVMADTAFPTESISKIPVATTASPTERNSLLFRQPTNSPVTPAPTRNVANLEPPTQHLFAKSFKPNKPTAKSSKSYAMLANSKASGNGGKAQKHAKSSKRGKSSKGAKSSSKGSHLYAGQLDRAFDVRANGAAVERKRSCFGLMSFVVLAAAVVVA